MTHSKQRLLLLVVVLIVLTGVLSRSWVASLFSAAQAAPGFTPPDEPARRAAIGPTDTLPPQLQRAFEPAEHFDPIPAPGPSDWLARYPEGGQTYQQFLRDQPHRPDKQRRKLYLQPLGEFPDSRSPDLAVLQEYARAFFGLPVEALPRVEMAGLPISSRQRGGKLPRQLLSTDVLEWLKPRIPPDAYCLLAVTMEDLYPEDGWNFVFGQASLAERVGVYSFVRYDPAFYGQARTDDASALILRRSCGVLAHETGHMFGLEHCIFFRCLMNGSNHLTESDRCPLHLCPVCLRKLHHAVGFDIAERYARLRAFSHRARWADETAWLTERLAFLE